MQVLLVSDDEGYADEISAAGDAVGVEVTLVDGDDGLDSAVRRIGVDAVVFDAQDEFPVVAEHARAFAVLHPGVVVAVVAKGVEDHDGENLLVQHRWRAPERLLGRLARAHARMPLLARTLQ